MSQQDNHIRLSVWLPKDLHRQAKIKAAETGVPMAEICRRALSYWIETGKKPPKLNDDSGAEK